MFQGAKKVKAQGMGVHTPEEVSQFGCADLKVLSDILADKPFFFGDEPTTVNFNSFIKIVFIQFLINPFCYLVRNSWMWWHSRILPKFSTSTKTRRTVCGIICRRIVQTWWGTARA